MEVTNRNGFQVLTEHPGKPMFSRVLADIPDLQRIISFVFIPVEAGGPRVEIVLSRKSVSVTEKMGMQLQLLDVHGRRFHMPYFGILKIGEGSESIIVTQVDRQLASSRLFQVAFHSDRGSLPMFHTVLLAYQEELMRRGLVDVLVPAPGVNTSRYGWWLGREWLVGEETIGRIDGRPVVYLCVWGKRGLLAVTGMNHVYFISARDILAAALANTPLDQKRWLRIVTTTRGIDFLSSVVTREKEEFIIVKLNSGSKEEIKLQDPEQMAASAQAVAHAKSVNTGGVPCGC